MKLKLASFALFFSILFLFSPAYADWSPPQSAPPTCPTGQPGCDPPLSTNQDADVGNVIAWSSASAVGPLTVFSTNDSKKVTKRFQVSAPDADTGFLSLFSANNAEILHLGNDGNSWFTGGLFGLGTDSPTATLDLNGSFRFSNPASLPAAGQVLTTDSDGNASWQDSGGIGGQDGLPAPDCDSAYRGRLWFTANAKSQDNLSLCAKNQDGVYGWQTLY